MLWFRQWLSGNFVPSSPVQNAAVAFLEYTAPLLEVERHAGGLALIADVASPIGLHGAGAGPGFAAYDDPADARETYGEAMVITSRAGNTMH